MGVAAPKRRRRVVVDAPLHHRASRAPGRAYLHLDSATDDACQRQIGVDIIQVKAECSVELPSLTVPIVDKDCL